MTSFKLEEATVFPQLNKKEGKDADYARDELSLISLKYKHFRDVLKYPERDQLHHLMMTATGLSEVDLGELTPNDAAEISAYVLNSIKKFMDLSRNVMKTFDEA